ncbi:MAG: exopolysaccharide biosynthesis polyprenyl glycosylphosphotransferase [Candidatus Marinimicrobia bacterium]|nr:exopolysaccharide biosynthesis polyprenyl glycosylphosphotransferase [Candidatus Neomarinimicrobiota bacterium]
MIIKILITIIPIIFIAFIVERLSNKYQNINHWLLDLITSNGFITLFSAFIGMVIIKYFLPLVSEHLTLKHYLFGLSCIFILILYRVLKINFKYLLVNTITAIALIVTNREFSGIQFPIIGPLHLDFYTDIILILWLVISSYSFKIYEEVKGLSPGAMILILLALTVISYQTQQYLLATITAIIIFSMVGTLRKDLFVLKAQIGKAYASLLGIIIGFISLESGRIAETSTINALVPLSILAMPMLESMLSIKRKYVNRKNIRSQFIHDRLNKLGFSHIQSTSILLFFITLTSTVGVSIKWITDNGLITLLFAVVVMIVIFIYRLGYIQLERNMILIDDERRRKIIKDRYLSFDKENFFQNLIFIGIDSIAICGAFVLTYYLEIRFGVPARFLISTNHLILWCAWSIIFWCGLFGLNDLYNIEWDTSRVEDIFSILKIIIFGAIVIFIINNFIKVPVLVTKGYFLIYLSLLIIGVTIARLIIISILRKFSLLKFSDRNTVVIGTGNKANNIFQQINNVPILKFDIIGFIKDNHNDNIKEIDNKMILGDIDQLPQILETKKIQEVIIAIEDNNPDKILNIVAIVDDYNIPVKVIPEYYNILTGFRTSYIHGISLAKFITTNMKTWEWILKRFIDIILSLIVLIVFFPFWLITAIAIKIDSSGPILYSQTRSGRNKKEFEIYKFRSMVKDAEKYNGAQWASKEDPRITKVGNFLRKSGIDEIPQFINVLVGDMSVVGPRPERSVFIDELEEKVKFYTRRLLVKPGITGWAQMKYKYDESIEDVKEKVKDDLYYIRNMSITLDLKIIVQTALTVFQKWKKHH